jgi:hypothetical protein
MAKEMKGSSKRLPIGYGHDDSAPLRKMDTSRARESSKEFAAGSPHPGHQGEDEGRAGRHASGSHELNVKLEHFNEHRKIAHEMKGKIK